MTIATSVQRRLTGRHVLLGLFAFFGVMLVANGFLVYYALSTFSGGDRPSPYRSGLNYNETIAEAERQAALGWTAQAEYDESAGQLTIRFTDSSGQPVPGLLQSGTLGRPAAGYSDRDLQFREESAGVYVSDVTLAPGNWVLTAQSSRQEDGPPVYRLKKRLIVNEGP